MKCVTEELLELLSVFLNNDINCLNKLSEYDKPDDLFMGEIVVEPCNFIVFILLYSVNKFLFNYVLHAGGLSFFFL